jgi:peptide/nickel transport system permease protein
VGQLHEEDIAVNSPKSEEARGLVSKPLPEWRQTFDMFCGNFVAITGAVGITIVIVVSIFGPMILSADPFEMVGAPLSEPFGEFLLGTDFLGRDVFAGIVYGARPTMLIAITSTLITVIVGLSIGALSGFYGGWVDNVLMRITEFFQVLPSIVLAIVLVAVFEPGIASIIFAIGITHWTSLARLTRAEFLKLKEREMVLAQRAVGATNKRLIWLVILPNALPPLIISMTLTIGICILFEAALSFLGLNDPEIITWGLMIGHSRDFFFEAWWTVTFPGLAILSTVLCIALIGDGLNDALNPKLRQR